MIEYITIGVSVFALLISCISLYVVNFWKGKIKCSKPILFFFGYGNTNKTQAVVSIQCFMHSTGIVGQVIDHMFLEVTQGETKQRFTSWNAGTNQKSRIKLAGFKVPRDGQSIDFIFATPLVPNNFSFNQGPVSITLNARLSGSKDHKILVKEELHLDTNLHKSIEQLKMAVFELNSTGDNYYSYIDNYIVDLPNAPEQHIKDKT